MKFTSFSKIGVGLGIIMLLLAFGQPVTVSDTQTTCIANDCSTIEYDRPNPLRAQLFGAAVFLIISSGILYAIGTQSTHTQSTPSHPPKAPRNDSPDEGAQTNRGETNPMTLREQLDAKQPTSEPVETGETHPRHEASQDAIAAASESAAMNEGTISSDFSSRQWASLTEDVPGFIIVTAASLLSAFLSSLVLSTVLTLDSSILQAVVFSLGAFPGLALYWYNVQNESFAEATDSKKSDL